MAKKDQNLVSMHWTRFVKSHLPFYLENDVPLQYKTLLFGYLYKTIAKRLQVTKGLIKRFNLKNQLVSEIRPLKLPFPIRIYLLIIAILPFSFLMKFYVYYIVPYYMNNHIKNL